MGFYHKLIVFSLQVQNRSSQIVLDTPHTNSASGLVVHAVVLDGGALRFAVPDGNRTGGLRLEHDLADGVTDDFRDATPRSRGGLAQRVKLFLAQVDLHLFHRYVA